MTISLDVTPLDFDPIAGDEASYTEGIRGHFPSEPGRPAERVHAYFDSDMSTNAPSAESWTPAPGWEGLYEVSNHGQVRSIDRNVYTKKGAFLRRMKGKLLKVHEAAGYPSVCLTHQGKTHMVRPYHLVAKAFIGPSPGPIGGRPDQWQINHKNGDRWDCRAENLEWVTGRQNRAHAELNGLKAMGASHGRALVNEKDVRDIRERYAVVPEPRRVIAERYGLSKPAVDSILYGRTWRRVGGPLLRTEANDKLLDEMPALVQYDHYNPA